MSFLQQLESHSELLYTYRDAETKASLSVERVYIYRIQNLTLAFVGELKSSVEAAAVARKLPAPRLSVTNSLGITRSA